MGNRRQISTRISKRIHLRIATFEQERYGGRTGQTRAAQLPHSQCRRRATRSLLNDLIRSDKQPRWDGQPEGFCRFGVHDSFVFGRRLHRQFAEKNLIGVRCRFPMLVYSKRSRSAQRLRVGRDELGHCRDHLRVQRLLRRHPRAG